jgi:hypothetical protein
MTNPFAVLSSQVLQALHSFNTPSPENPKVLLLKAVGTTILAAAIYKTVNFLLGNTSESQSSPTDEEQEQQQPQFEDKYFKEYDDYISQPRRDPDACKESLENMYYRTVRETINDFYGDVIMCYDHATFSFAYYARTANIPYKYLETISRKYMIETNAPREIHVDIRDEFNKAKNRNTAPTPTSPPTSASASAPASTSAPAPDTDVFVKLKSYNTAANLNLHSANNANANNTANANNANNTANANNANNATANAILREKANRYSYRGKLMDFHDNHKTFLAERRAAATAATAAATTAATAATETASLKSGYADFKRQHKKSAL